MNATNLEEEKLPKLIVTEVRADLHLLDLGAQGCFNRGHPDAGELHEHAAYKGDLDSIARKSS